MNDVTGLGADADLTQDWVDRDGRTVPDPDGPGDGDACPEIHPNGLLVCTRLDGHDGRHYAGGTRPHSCYAQWTTEP